MLNYLKSIAVFVKNWAEVISVINEKFDIIELVASMKLGEKPPRRLFRCGRMRLTWGISLVYGSTAPYSQNFWPWRRIIFSSTANWSAETVEIGCRSALSTQLWTTTWLRSIPNLLRVLVTSRSDISDKWYQIPISIAQRGVRTRSTNEKSLCAIRSLGRSISAIDTLKLSVSFTNLTRCVARDEILIFGRLKTC